MLQLQYETAKHTIGGLEKQLRQYKEEAHFWKCKYEALHYEYNQLVQSLNNKNLLDGPMAGLQQKQEPAMIGSNSRKISQQSIEWQEDMFDIFSRQAFKEGHGKVDGPLIQTQAQNIIPLETRKTVCSLPDTPLTTEADEQYSPGRSPRMQSDEIDFFSLDQIQKHNSFEQNVKFDEQPDISQRKEPSKGYDLIQGYFILQKIENFRQHAKKHDTWIRAANDNLKQKQTNLLEIVYRYTFRQEPLTQIDDDPFDSRVNEIKYGTPYQQLIYSFDNYQPSEEEESKIISKSIRKKYVHCLIRPQLTVIDGKQYETQILYGFVSPFPLRNFFIDIHRTLQQQIKFQILKSNKKIPEEVQVSKDMRIGILAKLMHNIFDYAKTNCSNIDNYPIKFNIQTKVSTISLEINSQQDMKKIQQQSLQMFMKKYSLLKISKILHHVMTEKQTILVSTSRKHLNEAFEMVRLILKPFNWVFPIIYRYSDHFEPFLSSPLPLLLGIVFDFNNKNSKENKILMQNQFPTIFVEQVLPQKQTFFFFSSNKPKYIPTDLREVLAYDKDIQFLHKYLSKVDKKSKSNESQRIQKYVNKLRFFIQTGKSDSQLTEFMIEFMDTQMVQCFKEILNGSNKKVDNGEDQDQNMAMTK